MAGIFSFPFCIFVPPYHAKQRGKKTRNPLRERQFPASDFVKAPIFSVTFTGEGNYAVEIFKR